MCKEVNEVELSCGTYEGYAQTSYPVVLMPWLSLVGDFPREKQGIKNYDNDINGARKKHL